jgi:hypothetical protein
MQSCTTHGGGIDAIVSGRNRKIGKRGKNKITKFNGGGGGGGGTVCVGGR